MIRLLQRLPARSDHDPSLQKKTKKGGSAGASPVAAPMPKSVSLSENIDTA